jgi:hypothetical protein
VVAQPEPIAGEPVKPAHLSDLAAAHWDELVDQLRKERRLHVSDGGSLLVAANLYAEAARWQQLSDVTPLVSEAGRVQECHVQCRLAWDTYRKAYDGLCLGQGSRSRAATPRKDESGQATSPLAQLQARINLQRVK